MGKYEEALERARQGRPIDEVFPELKESEDERIRKALVKEFKEKVQKSFVWKGIPNNAILNWLERQKEKKPLELERLDKLREMTKEIREAYERGVEVGKRIEQKPAEWSEGDEDMRKKAIEYITSYSDEYGDYNEIEKVLVWLKSLRPLPHWKPSEEQMKALKEVAYSLVGTGTQTDVCLVQLYEQLKKLM